MRPGEQPPEDAPPPPPGGGQHPPGPPPGPYQAGPYQPGPYSPVPPQPGPGAAGPYPPGGPELPTAPYPAAGPGPGDPGRRRKMVLASVLAVLLVAGVTGASIAVFAGGDGGDGAVGAGSPSPSPEETGAEDDPDDPDDPEPSDDPRGGLRETPDPVVAEDWQVSVNDARGIAYDVPPEWDVKSQTHSYYVERDEDIEADEDENPYLVAMVSPAAYLENWCGDDTPLAVAGVRSRQGATDTAALAELEATDWARAEYDQRHEAELEVTEGEPFTSEHGMTGHRATAVITGFPQDPDCPVTGGKVVVFAYVLDNGDLATWTLVTDTGVEDEPDEDTIEKIINSLRPHPAPQG